MISSHVLDTALGAPARSLEIRLELLEADGTWRPLASARTNEDGRVAQLADASALSGRTCRLTFETGTYFHDTGRPAFFPRVDVTFLVSDARYHIPLLLSPFGYSTYRGS
jgi:5-hydroxyisourate hydrolase